MGICANVFFRAWLNSSKTDIKAFFDQEPNKLSGKVILNGQEKLAGSASVMKGETDILYQANLIFNENGLQSSLRIKEQLL